MEFGVIPELSRGFLGRGMSAVLVMENIPSLVVLPCPLQGCCIRGDSNHVNTSFLPFFPFFFFKSHFSVLSGLFKHLMR